MPELHNSALLTVLLADVNENRLKLAQRAAGQNTSGNPLLAGIFVSDTAMHALGTDLLTEETKFKAKPPTSTKALVNSKALLLCTAYNKNAAYIQGVARDLVISSGDINQGINLILNAGYFYKQAKSPTKSGFDVDNEGSGKVKVNTIAVAPHAGYIRQYGITATKGVPPDQCSELLFSLEVDVILAGLTSGTILAIREASILPAGSSANSGSNSTNVEKLATQTTVGKAHHPIFNHGATSHYQWSEWLYIVVS
jgi:hypothetical protein